MWLLLTQSSTLDQLYCDKIKEYWVSRIKHTCLKRDRDRLWRCQMCLSASGYIVVVDSWGWTVISSARTLLPGIKLGCWINRWHTGIMQTCKFSIIVSFFTYFIILQDLLNRTQSKQPLNWYKTLKSYYYRDEWELYDLKHDAEEVKNLASEPAYKVSLIRCL